MPRRSRAYRSIMKPPTTGAGAIAAAAPGVMRPGRALLLGIAGGGGWVGLRRQGVRLQGRRTPTGAARRERAAAQARPG